MEGDFFAHDCDTPLRPEEDIRSPGTRVTESCEVPDMGTGDQ